MADYATNYEKFEALAPVTFGKYELARNNIRWSSLTKETGLYVEKDQIFCGPDKIVAFGPHRNEGLEFC